MFCGELIFFRYELLWSWSMNESRWLMLVHLTWRDSLYGTIVSDLKLPNYSTLFKFIKLLIVLPIKWGCFWIENEKSLMFRPLWNVKSLSSQDGKNGAWKQVDCNHVITITAYFQWFYAGPWTAFSTVINFRYSKSCWRNEHSLFSSLQNSSFFILHQ